MNTSNNNLQEYLLDRLEDLRVWFFKHIKIVLPAILFVCVCITVIIAVNARNRRLAIEQAEALALSQTTETESLAATITIPTVALEQDVYPQVNALVNKYYGAMASGDMDTVLALNNYVDDTEKIRIAETSKYIERYASVKVYTKTGPIPGSFLAYVYSELKFKDYDSLMPGMQAFYICTAEDGSLYINDGEESEAVTNYIREVSLQDDVVDLNNTVAVAFNDMLAEDAALSEFLIDLTTAIETSVGETLAKEEGSTVVETQEEEVEEESTEPVSIVKTVRATDVVNVRSSDSETADKVGKAQIGDEFKLLEERGNGWSKIEYEGEEAFVKSQYLEPAEVEMVVEEEEAAEEATEETVEETAEETDVQTASTVTVKETVRIRKSASTDSDIVATVYRGEKLDLVMKQADGWTKIKYNGQTAYVKSDYVE